MATSNMTFTCDIKVSVGSFLDVNLVRASNPGSIVLTIDTGNKSTMNLKEWPDSLDLVRQFETSNLLRENATDETVSLNFDIPAGKPYIFWVAVAAPNIRRIKCNPVTGTPMSFSPCPIGMQVNTPTIKTSKEDKQLTSDPNMVLIFAITVTIYGSIAVAATIAALVYIFRKSLRKARTNSLPPGVEDLSDTEQPNVTQNCVRNMDTSATSQWDNVHVEGYLQPVDSRNGRSGRYDEFDITQPRSDAFQNNGVLQTSSHNNEAFEPDYLNEDFINDLKKMKPENPGSNQDNSFHQPNSNEDNVSLHSYVDIGDPANLYHMLGEDDDVDVDDEPNAYKPKGKRNSKMPSSENNVDASISDELKLKLQARKIISEKE
ncbi:unnamed protein product [Owenia fusiformis]|uniref:Uncharacterized protein n=1 Tax=Owenia fusiformis TaxID=6347 RepID=A0A8S4Q778_OWEFU|nr:unnamed protein product [Owenia fusiformis]